jgi:formylglycine-generating enzyme required for sulfatase activity
MSVRQHPEAGLSLVELPGGTFRMGSDEGFFPEDGEGPVRPLRVGPFAISAHAVTNRQFAAFTRATGYLTEAERAGSSFVFVGFLDEQALRRARGLVADTPWWADVPGTCWSAPEGPGSAIHDRLDHPVVHVSHTDAEAFCAWAGLRLPSETEWEYAARGGLDQQRYPWGNQLTPDERWHCNIWQGEFPTLNTAEDGYVGTAPVDAFPPNGYGLHNVVGNVWEWCADWFDATGGPQRVIRGGSYLCHASYCFRYRVAARSGNTPDTSTGHMGFRVARDVLGDA